METIEETATAATEATETRRFRVFRFKRGDRAPHLDDFDVPVTVRTTLFDAMRWIQFKRDPSLALRHSCLHASCGTCGVRANGREVLMCVTAVHDHELNDAAARFSVARSRSSRSRTSPSSPTSSST